MSTEIANRALRPQEQLPPSAIPDMQRAFAIQTDDGWYKAMPGQRLKEDAPIAFDPCGTCSTGTKVDADAGNRHQRG